VTVVLIGKETLNSNRVAWEIEESLKKERPNGILAIRLDAGSQIPQNSVVGKALRHAGAEIIDWAPNLFGDAIDRACKAVDRIARIQEHLREPSESSSCARKSA